MKYYVVADVHGFYTELRAALAEKGFFDDKGERKLIICGDLLDRGQEARKVQKFILDLMVKDEVILIRGNHEDLLSCLIGDWPNYGYLFVHHIRNGTVDTVLQLTETERILPSNEDEVIEELKETPFVRRIMPKMLDYYETEHYIFLHGWFPCYAEPKSGKNAVFKYTEGWRNAEVEAWTRARWYNGMEAARQGVIEPNKTVVCGHFHASYGHSRIEGKCTEFGEDADFSPYSANGVLAIDAFTTHSHKVNCIVIDDQPCGFSAEPQV